MQHLDRHRPVELDIVAEIDGAKAAFPKSASHFVPSEDRRWSCTVSDGPGTFERPSSGVVMTSVVTGDSVAGFLTELSGRRITVSGNSPFSDVSPGFVGTESEGEFLGGMVDVLKPCEKHFIVAEQGRVG